MTSTDDVTENPESPMQVWPINILLQKKKKKAIKWLSGGRTFQQCWNNWISINKKLNLDLYFTPYTKIIWNSTLQCVLSHIRLCVTPPTAAHQASLSMGFPRQEYWSGLPFPPPGDLPDIQGSNPRLLHWQADSLPPNHLGIPNSNGS